jgi:hypothetical protein
MKKPSAELEITVMTLNTSLGEAAQTESMPTYRSQGKNRTVHNTPWFFAFGSLAEGKEPEKTSGGPATMTSCIKQVRFLGDSIGARVCLPWVLSPLEAGQIEGTSRKQ